MWRNKNEGLSISFLGVSSPTSPLISLILLRHMDHFWHNLGFAIISNFDVFFRFIVIVYGKRKADKFRVNFIWFQSLTSNNLNWHIHYPENQLSSMLSGQLNLSCRLCKQFSRCFLIQSQYLLLGNKSFKLCILIFYKETPRKLCTQLAPQIQLTCLAPFLVAQPLYNKGMLIRM